MNTSDFKINKIEENIQTIYLNNKLFFSNYF